MDHRTTWNNGSLNKILEITRLDHIRNEEIRSSFGIKNLFVEIHKIRERKVLKYE